MFIRKQKFVLAFNIEFISLRIQKAIYILGLKKMKLHKVIIKPMGEEND